MDGGASKGVEPNGLQESFASVHQHPYLTVIEKHERPLDTLISERRGTEWSSYDR